MKKIIFLIIISTLITCYTPIFAQAEDVSITNIASDLDFSDIEEFINEFNNDMEELNLENLWEEAKAGNLDISVENILNFLTNTFFSEVLDSGELLLELVALSIICLLLTNLQTSFTSSGIGQVSYAIVYLILISLALKSFHGASTIVIDAVSSMSDFIYAVMPLLLTLLVATGGVTSVAMFNPVFLTCLAIAINLINVVIMPLIYFSAVLGAVSYINPTVNLSKMAKLCRDIGLGLMSIVTTIFLAIMSLVGLSGAAIDGITIKAAKTATSTFVPIVGKTIADTFDTVLATSLLLKNTIGIAGIIIIIGVCALPAIKTLVLAIIFRLASALVQPLGNNNLADALASFASSLTTLFAIVVIAGIFFFFAISISLGMGNIAMMFR